MGVPLLSRLVMVAFEGSTTHGGRWRVVRRLDRALHYWRFLRSEDRVFSIHWMAKP